MRTSRAFVLSTAAVAASLLAMTGCAAAPGEPGGGPTGLDVGPDTVLAAQTTILQAGEDADPELCLAGVMESYPPQCGGPVVVGLDWADVADAETASGVTWGTGWVIGTYDRQTQVFTLTEPASRRAPDGMDDSAPDGISIVIGDGASDADLASAEDAMADIADTAGILTWGRDGGGLSLTVILADEATVQAVLDAVEPWLEPYEVSITGVLQPVG